jgi:hypothetical protein
VRIVEDVEEVKEVEEMEEKVSFTTDEHRFTQNTANANGGPSLRSG